MATKYFRTRLLIEESPNADYSSSKLTMLEDSWEADEFIYYDMEVPNTAEILTIATHFDTISRIIVNNNHASVAFNMTVTVNAVSITFDVPAGEWAELVDVSDASLTVDGDAAASHCRLWVWGS